MRVLVMIILAATLVPVEVLGQAEVWLRVENGTTFFLTPDEPDWIPAEARQRVATHAFLLTDEDARAVLFRATESYELPAGAYLFVEDVFPKSRMELVAALTRIEASQLPATGPRDREVDRPIGLTYGARDMPAAAVSHGIPFESERWRAVRYFYERERFDAALLMLKRSMQRFPILYEDDGAVELLLSLYARFQLHGFLLDEVDRLLLEPRSEPYSDLLLNWRERAQHELGRTR